MSAPLTQTQIPSDSILDLFGRQTYLGNSFILPAAGTSIANTVETPICVIQNPSGSGKSLFLFSRVITSNNNPVIARYYKNATVNVAGSATVALNLRTGATTVSVSVCYLGATITANGTLMQTLPSSTFGIRSDTLLIIDPNTSLLITAQQAAGGTSLIIPDNAWYEI